MKALLVLDVQNAIVEFRDFKEDLAKMEAIIKDFQQAGSPVLFTRHTDLVEESPLYKGSRGSELHDSLSKYATEVIEKHTPSSFYQTNLAEKLDSLGVDHIFIIGFNTEFCCNFTAIAGFDRGYKVTLIEDATGTVNYEETYEMPGPDIRDFVGTFLHWSNVIEVLDFEEYEEEYQSKSRP